MVLVSGAKVAVRVVSDDGEGMFGGMETVGSAGWDDECESWVEGGPAFWLDAFAVATRDQADAQGGVGMAGLVGARGDMKESQASVA